MNINKIVLLLIEKQKRKILLSICKNKNVCKLFGHSRWIYQEIRASNNMAKDCVNIFFFFFLFQHPLWPTLFALSRENTEIVFSKIKHLFSLQEASCVVNVFVLKNMRNKLLRSELCVARR